MESAAGSKDASPKAGGNEYTLIGSSSKDITFDSLIGFNTK
jgi:hypothetical protein